MGVQHCIQDCLISHNIYGQWAFQGGLGNRLCLKNGSTDALNITTVHRKFCNGIFSAVCNAGRNENLQLRVDGQEALLSVNSQYGTQCRSRTRWTGSNLICRIRTIRDSARSLHEQPKRMVCHIQKNIFFQQKIRGRC